MFEIRRVFNELRHEISKVNDADPTTAGFSMAKVVKEEGLEQLIDNIQSMLDKEAGRHPSQRKCSNNLHYNPVDYLKQNFGNTISDKLREEAVLSILQFSVQTQCMDQTVLQAVHLADNYLRFNQSCQPAFVRIIYAMAL